MIGRTSTCDRRTSLRGILELSFNLQGSERASRTGYDAGRERKNGLERSRFAADTIACSKRAASEILSAWSVSGYKEAILSLNFLVSSMNSDSKIVPQESYRFFGGKNFLSIDATTT